ncbi:MAG: sigma 54-interacting transcriptional regulator [Deltaproteobacteria bacterium]|nr:sigma 54-interacting transcriptional regulator [Deltaproteobacteria bacterium]
MKEITDFLVVANNPQLEESFSLACTEMQLTFCFARSFDDALHQIDSGRYKFVFVDLEDKEMHSLQILEWLKTRHVFSRIGVIYNKSYQDKFLQAVTLGATEYISEQDLDPAWLKRKLGFFIQWYMTDQNLKSQRFKDQDQEYSWVGSNPVIRWAFERAKEWSALPIPVLISGEKGTGKSFLAQVISSGHHVLVFDAKEIPEFEQKKTILEPLWEVLRVREEKTEHETFISLIIENIECLHAEIQELMAEYFKSRHFDMGPAGVDGHTSNTRLMMQFIGTSSTHLNYLVDEGVFRQDLLLLIRQNEIVLPALKERKDDIPFLTEFFISCLNDRTDNIYFSKDAMTAMLHYDWPGNIPELIETIRQVLMTATDSMVPSKLLPSKILEQSFYKTSMDEEDLTDFSYNEAKKRVLNKFNRSYIVELLKKSDNNLTVAAERAEMDRSNFKKIIKKFGLSK